HAGLPPPPPQAANTASLGHLSTERSHISTRMANCARLDTNRACWREIPAGAGQAGADRRALTSMSMLAEWPHARDVVVGADQPGPARQPDPGGVDRLGQ